MQIRTFSRRTIDDADFLRTPWKGKRRREGGGRAKTRHNREPSIIIQIARERRSIGVPRSPSHDPLVMQRVSLRATSRRFYCLPADE